MPKFHINAQVTISIHTIVEAATKEEALAIAANREIQSLPDHRGLHDVWCHSGELDGEPQEMAVDDDR